MSSDRDHAGPPSVVPTTASVEPPPTSTTATLPAGQSGSGDGAGEGELTLFVRREDAHRRASGRQERAHELVAVGALATRGGDDHLDCRRAEAARRVDEARHALGGLVDARRGEAPVPLDVLAEEQVLATLVERDEAGAVMAGHQKADGIRAYVDDGNVHSVVILQSPSAVTLSASAGGGRLGGAPECGPCASARRDCRARSGLSWA